MVSWLNPTSVLSGALAALFVAYLTSVYLVWASRRLADDAMPQNSRRLAIGAAVVAGAVALIGRGQSSSRANIER